MFVRWKTYEPREEKWFNRGDAPYYRAYLIESVRIDGKHRQKQHYLAAIKNGDLGSALAQQRFWYHAYKHMEELGLTEEQQEMIAAQLQQRVPMPEWKATRDEKHEIDNIYDFVWQQAEERAHARFLEYAPDMKDKPPDEIVYWRAVIYTQRVIHKHRQPQQDVMPTKE